MLVNINTQDVNLFVLSLLQENTSLFLEFEEKAVRVFLKYSIFVHTIEQQQRAIFHSQQYVPCSSGQNTDLEAAVVIEVYT
jgi:hypothetical protein